MCFTSNNTSFHKSVPSNRDETGKLVIEAVRYFAEMKKRNAFPHLDEYFFRLALDELVENAMVHGNRLDGSKSISVEIKPAQDLAEITVTGEGRGFVPSNVSNPRSPENFFKSGGRGLFIVQKIGKVRWNDRGNSVRVML